MRKPKALVILFTMMVSIVVLSTSLSGDRLDAVILATSGNYPDAIIAGAGSDKSGIPVLLTPPDVLPGKVADFLNETRPERIILVGGSAVISSNIEDALTADGFEVVRTWGVSRYGTAAEFATYMWQEGAEEAVLVYDVMGNAEGFEHIQLAMAKGLAAARKVPVLLTAGDALSAETSNALKELGVAKVLLVGTRFADNVTAELTSLGIGIEVITGKDENEVIKKLEDRAIKELREEVVVDTLVVIATAANDFLSTISMPNTVEASARKVISDESGIVDVIEFVKANGITEVKVVGIPVLVSKVAAQLLLIEGIQVTALSTTDVEKKLVDLVERDRDKWKEKRTAELKKIHERLEEKRAEVAGRVTGELEKAAALLDETESYLQSLESEAETDDQVASLNEATKVLEKAREVLEGAHSALDSAESSGSVDDYVRALRLIKKVFSLAKSASYEGANDFYGADAGRRREVVEEFLDRESQNMDRFVDRFQGELDKFKEFYEGAEEAGLLADECSNLVDEAEQLYEEADGAYHANDYHKVKELASRIKKNLQKCVTLTMQKGRDDKGQLVSFKQELADHRNKVAFADRITACRDKCTGRVDRCMDLIDSCADTCGSIVEKCVEGTRKMEAQCEAIAGQDDQVNIPEDHQECIAWCRSMSAAANDPDLFNYCVDRHCPDDQGAGKDTSAREGCLSEVKDYTFSCEAEAEDCYEGCDVLSEDKCRLELKDCVPGCVGERLSKDPRFAGEVCDIACAGDAGCIDDCTNPGPGLEPTGCTSNDDCDDNDACTTDLCSSSNVCHNPVNPECCNSQDECDDGNPCNLDRCIANKCRYSPNIIAGCCTSDTECDDGDPCTTDLCSNENVCQYNDITTGDCGRGHPGVAPMCLSDDDCVCHKNTGCILGTTLDELLEPGSVMSSTWFNCAIRNCVCEDGRCVNRPVEDGDQLVDPDSPAAIHCKDKGNDYTVRIDDDGKKVGVCVFADRSECDAQDFKDKSCGPSLEPAGCTSDEDCDDNDACTINLCSSSNVCHYEINSDCCNDHNECDDYNPCTLDRCIGSLCRHSPNIIPGCCTSDTECDDGNPCTGDLCSSSNVCHNPAIPECCTSNADCDDGFACTQDLCSSALCHHQAITTGDCAPAPKTYCGDGTCNGDEDQALCCADCGCSGFYVCHDGRCLPPKPPASDECAVCEWECDIQIGGDHEDCIHQRCDSVCYVPSVCGDGTCDADEDQTNCCTDCFCHGDDQCHSDGRCLPPKPPHNDECGTCEWDCKVQIGVGYDDCLDQRCGGVCPAATADETPPDCAITDPVAGDVVSGATYGLTVTFKAHDDGGLSNYVIKVIGDDGSGNIPVVLVSDIMPGTSFSGSATGNLAPVFNSFKAITLKVVDDSDNVCRDAVHVTGSLN
ncbi:MAG: cell wall-binding repeat-containing protein [Candidatus Undinarchaeales archaeon]|jgi:putative cell wall-binding protein|nr:cell wall-binding repeat-containing protein [Candidatus Undinarchaeales archaeon]MDP7494335.1 cell wall-binding repeat-containing protein [Candidatus Undinarchaeales archaeon]